LNSFSRNNFLWLIIFLLVLVFYKFFDQPDTSSKEISYSAFLNHVASGDVKEATIKEASVEGKFFDGKGPPKAKGEFVTNSPPSDDELIKILRDAKVDFKATAREENYYVYLLAQLLPWVIFIGIWVFFMRQMQVGGGKALSFGKSKARLMEEGPSKVTFADVAGVDESKAELESVVQFLKDPKKFTRLGGRIPKGVLLVGSPGTGKTLLAKAVAGEAGVPFFSISGSDFVEMFVGVGASRVRDLFVRGKKNAPCIIFIDEIDAVGRHRGAGLGGGHDEREQTLNQLLVEMDGFEMNEGVILVAATNRPDVLDPALLRPGRFDRTVVVPLPDIRGREAVLKVHIAKVPADPDVSLEILARGTPGFSGADLANLVNEAALHAALKDSDTVKMAHFDYAKDKIIMGVERRSLVLNEEERKVTAVHESGHALIAKMLPNADPVHKVTIVPRGVALGLMQQLPQDEKHTYSREYWLDRICIAFGGRAAEELVFGQITTGASGDIQAATNIARKMVCEWGMSDKLGPLAYGRRDEAIFLGKEFGHQRDYSEETAHAIDDEVRGIVETELNRARKIIGENRGKLEALAAALITDETLDLNRVVEIMDQN